MVAIIGALTALFAATIGIAQTDIKKVLAYSTVSQLGYMFMACGVGAFSAGIFHLMTHAFFKGLLFLAAGSVIHGVGGEQDMRKMGGLRQYMPGRSRTMGIATLAIAGIPRLAGFLSKDEILSQAFEPTGSWVLLADRCSDRLHHVLLYVPFDVHDFRRRLPGRVEHRRPRCRTPTAACDMARRTTATVRPHESPWVMLAPLVVLAHPLALSVDGFVCWGNHFEHFLDPVFKDGAETGVAKEDGFAKPEESNGLEYILMAISVAWPLLAGLCLALAAL